MKKSRSRLIPFLLAAMMFAGSLSGKEVDRWSEQTPFRNQHDRRTCITFASIAAIEAAYVRLGYVQNTFDLSEQYLFHIWKSTWLDLTPPMPIKYENQSCYWGGGSLKDIVAVLENYRIPEERFCPYENDEQMQNLIEQLNFPTIPIALRNIRRLIWAQNNPYTQEDLDTFEYDLRHIDIRAHRNARFGAKKVVYLPQADVQNTNGLEDLIDQEKEVVILMDDGLGIFGEAHAILLVGYDDKSQMFYFKNSNTTVPTVPAQPAGFLQETGKIALTYDQIDNFASEGLYIESVHDPQEDIKATFLGTWNLTHDGWRGKMVIRRIGAYDQRNPDPHNFLRFDRRLGTYYDEKGRFFPLTGTTEGNEMEFWLDFSSPNALPDMMNRQKFTVYVYGQGNSGGGKMAGVTEHQGASFGVFASREDLPTQKITSGPVQPEEIRGLWVMEHDGWEGLLAINKISKSNIEGIYTFAKENKQYAVKGQIDKHHLVFEILFPGKHQKFEGHILSGDRNIMAGVTWWNNKSFGFHALKKWSNLPDLTIKKIDISPTPEELYEPASLWPRVIIENRGDTVKRKDLPIPGSWVLFQYGGGKIDEGKFNISRLQEGKEISQGVRLKQLQRGTYRLQVQVDDEDKIGELNEDNNTQEVTFRVKAPFERHEPFKQIPPSREPRGPVTRIGFRGGMTYGATDFPVFKGGEFSSDVYSELPEMGGYSFSKWEGGDNSFRSQDTHSFRGGLSLEIFPFPILSLEVGANYAEKATLTKNPGWSDYFDKTTFQTVSIPFILKLNLGRGYTGFFIGGGFEGTYIFRIKNRYHHRIGGQIIDRTFDRIGTTRLAEMLESPFSLSAVSVAGFRFGKITLEARYLSGLTDIIFKSFSKLNIGQFEGIQALLGFWF